MSGAEWVVRAAIPEDLGRCAELAALREGGPTDGWRERFTALLESDHSAMFVGVADEVVIAYGRAQLLAEDVIPATPALPSGFFLLGVVVDPAAQRMGIGRALCQRRISWVHGFAKDCWFFTNVNNMASRALHQAVGFIEIREFRSAQLDGGVGVLGLHGVV